MNEILHANIFFVITSIAAVLFTIIVSVILYQIYKIIKVIRRIIERIDATSEVFAEDVVHIRQLVAGGGILAKIMSSVFGFKNRRSKD